MAAVEERRFDEDALPPEEVRLLYGYSEVCEWGEMRARDARKIVMMKG